MKSSPKPEDMEPDPSISFDDVVRRLLAAKPVPRKAAPSDPGSSIPTAPPKAKNENS